jgi:HlyD family secretion protein
MNRIKEVGFLVSLLGVIGLAGCSKSVAGGGEAADTEASAPVAVEMAKPTVQAVEITVSAQGTLSPAQGASVRVASPVAGRLLALTVQEGEQVRAGQVLARIDNRPQQATARSAQVAVSVADAQARSAALSARAAGQDQNSAVQTAQLAVNAARLDRAAALQQAQNALDSAQTDLNKTRAGARPQEIAQANQAVVQAQATRDRAVTERDRIQFLFDRGVSARRQLDDALTALAVANSGLESAQQAASLLKAGARQEDIRAAELHVAAAQGALAAAQKSGEARILQAQAALRQAEQSRLNVAVKQQDARALRDMTAQKQADLAAATATAAYGEIRAPIDGKITKRSANVGDLADPATPFLEISNANGLNLIANLPAEDGLKVRPGMDAHIASTDVPGRSIAGRVLSVGQVDPQSNLLSVRVGVVGPPNGLRVGAFATADIVLRSMKNVVVVPRSAVVTQEGKSVVFTIGKGDTAHKNEVTLGPEESGGKMISVLSGLKPDESVVSTGGYELTDGAKVKTAEAAGGDKESKESKDKEARPDAKTDAKNDDARAGEKGGKP